MMRLHNEEHISISDIPHDYSAPLPDGSRYSHLSWRLSLYSSRDFIQDFTVVWVNLERLMELAGQNPTTSPLPPISSWPADKASRYMMGLDPDHPDGLLEMPDVCLFERTMANGKCRWWTRLFSRKRTVYVGFTNGRHRAAMARHLGAKVIPVRVRNSNVSLMLQYCGASARELGAVTAI